MLPWEPLAGAECFMDRFALYSPSVLIFLFFLMTFSHLLSLLSVSPVLLLHSPHEKGVPKVLLEGGREMLETAAEESR